MSKIARVVAKVTTVKTTVSVNKQDLINAVRTHFGLPIPDDADVCIRIPGGGDWSNELLDVNDDHPVTIDWETKTNE